MPATQTQPVYPKGLDFEQVWAALMENREQLKETERILKEQAESSNNRIGALTNLFGDVTEAMVAPKICEKFEEFGLYFPKANRNSRINDRVNKISFEVDIMLENGERLC